MAILFEPIQRDYMPRKYWGMARDEAANIFVAMGAKPELIKELEHGVICESTEEGGSCTVSELTEDTAEAVEIFKWYFPHLLPYHVITRGDWHAILYVEPELYWTINNPNATDIAYSSADEAIEVNLYDLYNHEIRACVYTGNSGSLGFDCTDSDCFTTIIAVEQDGGLVAIPVD